MAIAFDSSSAGNYNGATSSLTFSHACSGDNRILVVGWVTIDSNSRTLVSVTYDGVPATGSIYEPYTPPGFRYNGLVYFTSPNTGTHDIVITVSGNVSHNLIGAAISYTGCKLSGIPHVKDETVNMSTLSVSTTMTTTTENCWIAGVGLCNDAGTFSAGTNTTMRTKSNYANGWLAGFDSNGARSAGSNSIECVSSVPTALNMMSFAIEPYIPPPSITGITSITL